MVWKKISRPFCTAGYDSTLLSHSTPHFIFLRICKTGLIYRDYFSPSCSRIFEYVSSISSRSLLFQESHGSRLYFIFYTISLSDEGTYLFACYITISQTSWLDSSIIDFASTSHISTGFDAYAATCRYQPVLQHFRTQSSQQSQQRSSDCINRFSKRP